MSRAHIFVRFASRAVGNASTRRLTAAGRGSVRNLWIVSSHQDDVVLACSTPTQQLRNQGGATRYHNMRHFSEGGKEAAPEIDRSEFTEEVKVEMPEIGEDSETSGVIEKWYKKEGDIIRRDEVICDIRTELFTFGMLTDDEYDSIMGKILVQEETDPIEHGTVICTTLHRETDGKKEEKGKEEEQ